MPYARPTLSQLRAQALQDITTANIQDSSGNKISGLLQKSVLRVLSWVMAGYAWLHYDYQDYIAQNATPWGATQEFAVGWGALKGVVRKDATPAMGKLNFTNCQPGTVIPDNTQVVRYDGVTYTIDADWTVQSDGTCTVTAECNTYGAVGNCAVGTPMALVNSITGIDGACTSGLFANGADMETEDQFKTRYLQKYAAPPQGGDASDYIEWAMEVPGVTRAWVNPYGAGPGSVVVYTMFDNAEAAGNGFPQGTNGVSTFEPRSSTKATGDQLAVADHIFSVQPVTALVYSAAPYPYGVDFVITTMGPAGNSSTVKAAITSALADALRTASSPLGTYIYPNVWETAIASVPGVTSFTVTNPAGPVLAPLGYIPIVNSVTCSA